jgi:hypothetical protein
VEFHDVDVEKGALNARSDVGGLKSSQLLDTLLVCYLTSPNVVCANSSLVAVITVTASSIDTSLATESLPLDNTIVTSNTVKEIPVAVVEELPASIVDSLVNLGLVFPWKWRRLLDLFSDQRIMGVHSYRRP